jgi:hypothetical protein
MDVKGKQIIALSTLRGYMNTESRKHKQATHVDIRKNMKDLPSQYTPNQMPVPPVRHNLIAQSPDLVGPVIRGES